VIIDPDESQDSQSEGQRELTWWYELNFDAKRIWFAVSCIIYISLLMIQCITCYLLDSIITCLVHVAITTVQCYVSCHCGRGR